MSTIHGLRSSEFFSMVKNHREGILNASTFMCVYQEGHPHHDFIKTRENPATAIL